MKTVVLVKQIFRNIKNIRYINYNIILLYTLLYMDNINILVKNYMNSNKQFIVVISCFDYGFIRNYELDFRQFYNCKVITYHKFKTIET